MDNVSLSVLLASITAYGATVTKIVDAVRKLDTTNNPRLKWVWNVLALVVGVVIGLLFHVDLASSGPLAGHLGEVLTGLAIGASGSGWHEVFDTLSGAAKAAHAKADAVAGVVAGAGAQLGAAAGGIGAGASPGAAAPSPAQQPGTAG